MSQNEEIPEVPKKRLNIDIEKSVYNELKGTLAVQGVTISQWVRLCIDLYLSDMKDDQRIRRLKKEANVE